MIPAFPPRRRRLRSLALPLLAAGALLHLTPVQIAKLHEAAALSCERAPGDEGGFASWYIATVKLEPYEVFGVSRPMTITVDGRGKLTVRIGRKTVTAEDLDIATRVNAIDWIELGGPTTRRMPRDLQLALDNATFRAGMQDER